MAERLRGAQHTTDWLGGQSISRSNLQQEYPWLHPCENPFHQAQRDGPLQRLRPRLAHAKSEGALPSGAARGGAAAAKKAPTPVARSKCLPVSRGRKGDHTLWAVGSVGPARLPPTAEEHAWRQLASGAVRAAAAVRVGGDRGSGPAQGQGRTSQSRRRQGGAPASIQEVPDVDQWDSVSQAPSNPGTPSGRRGADWDARSVAQSAETATQSHFKLPPHERDDYFIAEHLARQRGGWYDWHGGKMFG